MIELYVRFIPDFVLYIVVYATLTDCQQLFESYYTKFIENHLIIQHKDTISDENMNYNDNNYNTNSGLNYVVDIKSNTCTNKMNRYPNLAHIIENRNAMYNGYVEMFNKTEEMSNKIMFFVVMVVSFTMFCIWYCITLLIVAINLSTDKHGNSKYAAMNGFWSMYYIIISVASMCFTLMMIYPSILWSDKYDKMKQQVSDGIDLLIRHRTQLHLKEFEITSQEDMMAFKYDNIDIERLSLYSQENIALECLNRFYRTINDKPCIHTIFGVPINKSNLKIIVVGFIVGKILSFMWNTVNLD